MKRHTAWTDVEIQDAVVAYFELLNAQRNFVPVNKSEIYRKLSVKHPIRTAKSFEYKFQNISAILYEEKQGYVDGLQPKSNYQAALKNVVLDYLKLHIHKNQTPIEILIEKLKRLRRRSFLPIQGAGAGRFGLTLEYYLNIPQNNSKIPDFMGIELKTKHDNSLQTLFSRVPSRYLACEDKKQLLQNYGYYDKSRNRRALYTSFNNTIDSLGFYLSTESDRIVVNRNKLEVLDYNNSVLENALLSKHNETAYLSVSSRRLQNGDQGCQFNELLYCRTPSMFRFLRMASDGNVYLNFTLSEKSGRVSDHGFLWRIPQKAIADLYINTELIDLTKD